MNFLQQHNTKTVRTQVIQNYVEQNELINAIQDNNTIGIVALHKNRFVIIIIGVLTDPKNSFEKELN